MSKLVLVQALKLIEAGWCQWTEATDKEGNSVERHSPLAANYCIMGALGKVTPNYNDAIAKLRKNVDCGLATWNDVRGRTKEEVIDLFRRAIADE